MFCFVAGFCRPIYSIVQDNFQVVVSYADEVHQKLVRFGPVIDEIVFGMLLILFVRSNLRAGLRPGISISDASEQGGGAVESTSFLSRLDRQVVYNDLSSIAFLNEEGSVYSKDLAVLFCCVCLGEAPACGSWGNCSSGCRARLCTYNCWSVHQVQCRRKVAPTQLQAGVVELGEETFFPWALAGAGATSSLLQFFSQCQETPGTCLISVNFTSLWGPPAAQVCPRRIRLGNLTGRRIQPCGGVENDTIRSFCKYINIYIYTHIFWFGVEPHFSVFSS